MKQGRFSDKEIIAILREHEAGTRVPDICRKHDISDVTFYRWKAKFGSMQRLKALEDENARLKRLLVASRT